MNIIIAIIIVFSPLVRSRALMGQTSNSMSLVGSSLQSNEPATSSDPVGGELYLNDMAVVAAALNLANNVLTQISSTIGVVGASISEWLAVVNIFTSGLTLDLTLITATQILYIDAPANRVTLEKLLSKVAESLKSRNASGLLDQASIDIEDMLPIFESIRF